MALNNAQIKAVWYDYVAGQGNVPLAFSKPDLAAAVAAVDAWMTANAASFNAALPDPFKSTASQAQKAQLLALVALKRYVG